MAHPVESMDIDSDFDNKENSFHRSNVQPCTEKGYEELDVSELNMKLRYSVTPASSPMSKSYTANCVDRSIESGDDSQNITINENANLTRSLNSSLKNDNIIKSLKALPLQSISTEQFNERSTSVLRPLDTTITPDNANVTVTVSGPNDIDDNLSLPSTSSSAIHTPEATTPTKESPKTDGSPIMRGLKSVLNMFRSSQSPIPPESEGLDTQDILSPTEVPTKPENSKTVMASTPISSHRKKETSPSKRNSPHKESIVFNDDLEKELLWKDETTILFSQERIPIHKLFFQQTQPTEAKNADKLTNEVVPDVELHSTVEYMDISYNDSMLSKTMTGIQADGNKIESNIAGESDSEFVDCETTFTKNESQQIDKEIQANQTQDLTKDMTKNESTSKLKPIILNTTQDILDATLSITPEDIFTDTEIKDKENIKAPEKFNETKVIEQVIGNEQETTIHGHEQKIDQAFEITSQAINTESDELNVTKTIENSTTEIGNNSTLKHTDNLNETKTIETCTNIDSKLLEQVPAQNVDAIKNQSKIIDNLNITNTIETEAHIDSTTEEQATAQNLDATHTIEYQPKVVEGKDISVLPCESFDLTHTVQKYDIESQILIDQIPQLDIRKSVESISAEDNKSIGQVDDQSTEPIAIENNATGEKLEDRPINPTSNMNVTKDNNMPIEDKIDDQGNNPVLENNNLITEHEFAIEQVNITNDIIDTPNVNNLTTVEETRKPNEGKVDGIVPKLEKSITLDETPFELPVDIPLPDEDDIDKELEVRVENNSSVPSHVPGDLDDDMKTKIEDTNSSEVKPTTDREAKLGLSEILPTNFEGNVRKTHILELAASELAKESHEINEIDTEQNIPENVNNEIIPKVIPAPDNLTIGDEKTTDGLDNSKVIHETCTIMEPTINVTLPSEIPESKPEVDIPMDVNESVCEQNPLPDIINQITTSYQGDNEQPIQDELKEQQTSVELATIGDNIENITVEIPPATEIVTAIDNTPQESGDINVCEKTKSSDIANEIVADIPSVPKIDAAMIIIDAIVNMSIDENMDSTENVKDDLRLDITTPTSTPETNNMSPKPNTTTLINTSGVTLGDTGIEDANVINEEVVASENNSPFVCVMAEPDTHIDYVDTKDSFATKTRVVCTPPTSPPISSKGYNFNFDEYDDPFATKAKMRMSPTLDTPNKCAEPKECEQGGKNTTMHGKDVNNRRKSQPGRKRPPPNKNKSNSKFNKSLDTTSGDKPAEKIEDESTKVAYELNKEIKLEENRAESYEKEDKEVQDIIKTANKNIEHKLREALKVQEEIKCIDEKIEATPIPETSSVDTMEVKNSSSSEQSTYFSAGTSSSESIKSKNVFNLPEIDDVNFNPFVSKSKIRQSPLLSQDIENPFATRSNIISSPKIPLNDANMTININEAKFTFDDKMETEVMEKDCSTNISNTTTSSKATDERDTTIKEVNTEDEDTAEGPFLDVEDMHDEVKPTEFDTENDMMQFNEVPPQVKAENQDDELFIDAEAFDFLLNQNKSNTVVDSGKESLFLKFDPLFAKRTSSDGVLAALTQLQKRQSTPTKLSKLPEREPISPIAGPSNMNVTHDVDVNTSEYINDELNVTVSKPTMAVPPAVNPVTPRNKSVTPTRPNRRSVTFTSPAMAVIDRLLSLSANNSPIYDNTFTYVSREQNEANLALTQLRELLAEKEVHVYNLRAESKELKDRLTTMESQVRSLETESQTRLQKINDLNKTLVEKTKINKSMALVVEEYERTIASLISEIEQDKKRHAEERLKLINERDEQTVHLSSMEVSFSDLHSKYEKSKQVIFSCKANEDVYKKSLKEFEENVIKMQNNFDLLKQHATSKLNHANQELEAMNRAHEGEVLKLNAMIKRKELHITSLEETLAQKTKANEELTAICDELINKVG